MKILLISNLYPPHFIGGLELSAKRIADELTKRGHDIYILTGKHEDNNKVKESNIFRLLTVVKPYLKNISIFKKYYWIVKKELFNYTNYKITRRVAKEIKSDIGYIWNLLDVSWSPVLAMRSLRIPIVFHLGDYGLKKLICYGDSASNLLFRYLKQAISKILLKSLNPKYLIVTSKILKDEYLKAGLSPEKITIIHRGVNTQLFKKQTVKRKKNKVCFLYSGRLHEAKGVHILIEAFSSLVKEYNHRNVFLTIVGEGVEEYEERLKKIVEEQKIKVFVYFHKKVPFNKMPAVYNKNDILVIYSIWKEPFGLVTIEAMACGLAVIGTTSGGPKEVIQDGVTGFLVKPNNPEQLAHVMNRLVKDNRLREKMKAEGLKVVHEKFKMEMEVDVIEKYLAKIIKI